MNKKEIIYAYCQNEMWAGYPCGIEGCPHCGGPEGVEGTLRYVAECHDKEKQHAKVPMRK